MNKFTYGTAGKPLSLKNKFVIEAPAFLKSIGLGAMEYEAVRGVRIDEKSAKLLGGEARKYNVKLSLHAPYYINLASPRREVVSRSINRIIQSINAASWMNAWIVVFHPGYTTGHQSRIEALKKAVENLEKPSIIAEEENIWLGAEVSGKVKQIGSLEEVVEISLRISKARPVIDWAHLYARNHGLFPKNIDDVLKVIDYIESNLGSEYVKPLHMHFSKIEYGKGGEIRHHTLSEPYGPDYEIICKALCSTGILGVFISESPVLEHDALLMKELCMKSC